MPMYEYKCAACGEVLERYEAGRNAGNAERVVCLKCGKKEMERIISAFSSTCSGGSLGGGTARGGSGGCGQGGFT